MNVQLIRAASDSHLWAETFDRRLIDIFSVESEVAKAIADQLRAKLTGQEEEVITARPTNSPQAYDAYLRGLAYTLKTGNSPANTLEAQKYLKEAVRLDPKFAVAWALLSYVDALGYLTLTLQPTEALRDETGQAAETALALQPNLGEAILAKGYYYYACLKSTTPRCTILNRADVTSCRTAVRFLNRWPMSRVGEVSGNKASPTSTKLSASTHATLRCSPNTRNPT